ncbi:nuclear transport factor 2 family protein [Obesumbacterium proteus]|uniref:nuclear transport factor 2 family protein n=1 Tax=Obesumbacterium proteus TaxID=82983 RepID=UPI001F449565|nr:nuclear transport factor 2 family protein [Obesumbacterium proteus]MCE9884211.1 nuclear transport factor 2 family protein [Obesumbacterium proteus]MCE9917604.1 nuclear transport factor 2 family protein [Obesumbacterium proteus]MCE9928835.1 nuclear transport factor 2 family protein [Obesumbacterium proteus]MCG2875688.1 nuclear transport factor 2 family protein [Obesumbacterium proteus]
MTHSWEDRLIIADLMTGWMHRDLAEWDKMLELFHPDGTIEVTWFEGLFTEFVKGSQRMGNSALVTKHLIGSPMIQFNGDKAIAETNAMIVIENAQMKLGASVHNRFYDWVEKRNGVWKIAHRQSIYDFGSFNFPQGIVEIDKATAEKFPIAYAPLAYLLEKSGFPLSREFASKGSMLETEMKAEGQAWLKG